MLEMNVAKGIHRIEDAHTNWYIVEDGDLLTVVDAGLPGSWTSLQSALDRTGHSLAAIEAIVLTHAHVDHIGFAERARRELGVPVFVHQDDLRLARRPFRYKHERSPLPYLRNPKLWAVAGSFLAKGALLTRSVTGAIAYSEGVLSVPGSPRIVGTPGHTHGHCSLFFEDRDAVIAGDAIVTLDPYTGRVGPRLPSRAGTADSRRALASLDALGSLSATTVLTGHGEPWSGGIQAAVDEARRRSIS
jgi:glyoxylase-like metal-dependent hydrolase (beta-lactamase superfamily II)